MRLGTVKSCSEPKVTLYYLDDEYATGSIIDHSDIEPTVPVFKTNPHYIAQYAIADSLPGLPPAPATQDDYPEVGTWSQSHSFILNKVATESLFQEKGWLSSDVVDASCCLTINEWLEGADVEDNLSKLLFVPSNAWQLFTSPTSSPLSFAHSPRPLQSRYIVIPVNDANHWFLILIFDAVEALHPNTGTPTAVVLDSLPAQGAALDDRMKRYSTLIKRFLVALARSSKSPAPHRKRFEVNLIPFKVLSPSSGCLRTESFPKSGLPLQTNTHDCGLYPAYYLRSFLKRPDDMEVGFKVSCCRSCPTTGAEVFQHPKPQIPPEWWYPQYHWHLRRGLQQRVSLLFQEIGRA